MMDSEDSGLTEFAADGDLDLSSELEATTRAAARQGVWPAISRYETPTGDGAVAGGASEPWRPRLHPGGHEGRTEPGAGTAELPAARGRPELGGALRGLATQPK